MARISDISLMRSCEAQKDAFDLLGVMEAL